MNKKAFSNWSVNDILALGSATRAQTGFGFIERCLDEHGEVRDESTSAPYSRQLDILISYNFELLLNAGGFIDSPKTEEKELLDEVKGNHNLDSIWSKIKNPDTVKLFEISSIKPKRNGIFKLYTITLRSGEKLDIEDQINIRYDINDFRNKMPTHLRLTAQKGDVMDKITEISRGISKRIIDYLHAKYQ